MDRRVIPREVHIAYVIDRRTGATHNVLEVCGKERGVRFVMAQDSETAKERDKYKLRAHLQAEHIGELEVEVERLHQRLYKAIYDVLTDCEHLDEARAMLVVALPKELKGGEEE